MKVFKQLNPINLRLLAEVSASGFLAFIMVSVVQTVTSPAAFSMASLMPV